MQYIKLQAACFLLIIFISALYIYYSQKSKVECHKLFDLILIFCPLAVFFDGLTAITVNNLETVPLCFNNVFHGAFILIMDFMIIASYAYMLDKTAGIPKSHFGKILVFAPSFISVVVISASMHKIHYVLGSCTNYSMGFPVYACITSLAVHFLRIMILIVIKRRNLRKTKMIFLLGFMSICLSFMVLQVIFPEILISSLFPTFILVSFYMGIEDPAIQLVKKHKDDMITNFATLVENRDNNTGGHIRRTQEYVHIILNEMKRKPAYIPLINHDYMTYVINAAPMHDIGKISTPDSILQKPGKLTAEEYEIMKKHAEKGGEIIQETFSNMGEPEFKKITYEVARHHHEKWNGNGYPDGLKGEEIPLHARIMAIADVFDAVSAKRCYRDAMPVETCFKIIEEGAGKDFDPDLVKLFLGAKEKILAFYSMKL